MARRGELRTLGERTVPVAQWVAEVVRHVEGQAIATICADRFKASELGEALDAASIRAPVHWRGFGWKDGAEDIERFRRWVFDQRLSVQPSLLMRSALEGAVTVIDDAGNSKISKGKSTARIDAAAAAVLAVAEASRLTARPVKEARAPIWA
jgi:phage terminase large subunit-like protein